MNALDVIGPPMPMPGPVRWHCLSCGRFVRGATVQTVAAPWETEADCARCGKGTPAALAPT